MKVQSNTFLDKDDEVKVSRHTSLGEDSWPLYLSFREGQYASPSNVHLSWEQAEALAREILAEVDGHRHDEEEAS
jgi:hypothetical protein